MTNYFSPADFCAKVKTNDTLELSGLPWVPTTTSFVYVRTMRARPPHNDEVYCNGSHVLTFDHQANTLRVHGADFHPDDIIQITMVGPKKQYNPVEDYNRTTNVNPVAREELVELKCTGCGGTLERPQAGGSVQCEYCGKPYYLKQTRQC